jgi:hypothetical protein
LKETDVTEVFNATIIGAMTVMEAVYTSETSVYFNETSWRCIP